MRQETYSLRLPRAYRISLSSSLKASPRQQSKYNFHSGDGFLERQAQKADARPRSEVVFRIAVLLQAWNDWHNPDADPPMSRLERARLRAWLVGQWPGGRPYVTLPGYSFADLCGDLGLDPDRTRSLIVTTSAATKQEILQTWGNQHTLDERARLTA